MELYLDKQTLKELFDEEFKQIKRTTKTPFATDYFKHFMDSKKEQKKFTQLSIQKYDNLKNILIEFEKATGHRLRFSNINDDFFSKYTGHLRTERKYQDNTLARHIVFLKSYLNWCTRAGYNTKLDYQAFSSPTRESDHIALTKSELEQIEKVKLDSDQLEEARDLFLIGCYSGQRFSDYSVFEKADIQDGMIIKDSKKMKQKSFIPLHSKLQALLDKYEWVLPKLPAHEFIPLIRTICEKAKMIEDFKRIEYRGNKRETIIQPRYEMVGTHTARRTFITLAAERGIPDHEIMKVTGIRDVKTLHRYKKVNIENLKNSINKMWE